MSPHIARVGSHEEGQVADQPDAPGTGMSFESFPLTEQQELGEANLIDPTRQVSAGASQGGRLTFHDLRRPLEVVGVVVLDLESAEEGRSIHEKAAGPTSPTP